MNDYSWIERALEKEGFSVPVELTRLIKCKKWEHGNFIFLDEAGGKAVSKSLTTEAPDHRIIAFALRCDYEAHICLVLEDKKFDRGSVVQLHDYLPWDSPSEVYYPSMQAWAQEAEKDIAERIANGWDEPYDDDTSDKYPPPTMR